MSGQWGQGRESIDALINDRRLERVSADRNLANNLISEAKRHLASAALLSSSDPTGSFQLAYVGARKALAAVLLNQGLRSTSKGGHVAVEEAMRAQIAPPMNDVVSGYGWMRKLRSNTEYPSPSLPAAGGSDALEGIKIGNLIVGKAEYLLDQMPNY